MHWKDLSTYICYCHKAGLEKSRLLFIKFRPPALTGFYWLLLTLTDFYWLLPTLTGFYWLLLALTSHPLPLSVIMPKIVLGSLLYNAMAQSLSFCLFNNKKFYLDLFW